MRYRDRERIRGVGTRQLGEPEHDADHLRDLCLLGPPGARDCELHARGGVLEGGEPRTGAYEEAHATCMTELRCSLGVLREEDVYKRQAVM